MTTHPYGIPTSKLTYIVKGSVRGKLSEHKRLSVAVRSMIRDSRQCGKLGGGAYSDARVYVHDALGGASYRIPIDVDIDGTWSIRKGDGDGWAVGPVMAAVLADYRGAK